ncbi:MAG TPA: guanitoxin biosynthesis pre-guanitoxin forming N-methyltransferase GntF, partial [Anaerolineae bacterium]|nr:guanitoxin biosynthesis pre-guanitoxin forming N-methyltransferase GntF [Anaerolineae bacterium]
MITPPTGSDYIAAFDPKAYLAECYDGPDEEHIFNIQFLVEAVQSLPPDLMVLEVGGGPTLHSAAAVASHAREIHFCDYVPANLAEVRRWLDGQPDAFDWRPFIQVALLKANLPATPAAVEQRAAEMRRKLTRLLPCDVLQHAPLGDCAGQYDLVLAPHCTDVAAATPAQWQQVMHHITTLVKPGGRLFIAVTTGATRNTVGSKVFPCVDLSVEAIYQGYLAAGYDPHTFQLASIPAAAKYEFTGVAYAIAQKNPSTHIPTTTNA